MNHTFQYTQNDNLKVESISVVGSFNDFDPEKGIMKKDGNTWYFSTDLDPGEHYYRFLINNELELNDKTANIYYPSDEGKLYSVIMINNENKRLFNNTLYNVNIDSYSMSQAIHKESICIKKSTFYLGEDSKVVTRFGFSSVTGLHLVTVLFKSPDGNLFEYSESPLFTPEDDTNYSDPLYLWFWLSLTEKKKYMPGHWMIQLFIDGDFILEDTFMLTSEAKIY